MSPAGALIRALLTLVPLIIVVVSIIVLGVSAFSGSFSYVALAALVLAIVWVVSGLWRATALRGVHCG